MEAYLLNIAREIENCGRCSFFKNNEYDFYGVSRKPSFMITMQNPGAPKGKKKMERVAREKKELKEAKNTAEKIRVWQRYLTDWILNENERFFTRFFSLTRKYGLVEFHNWKSYVGNEEVFTDFHFTDAVKCRADINRLDEEKNCFEKCFHSFLKREIDYLKPKIIFAFSSRTWSILKGKLKPRPITSIQRNASLVRSHGHLFKYDENQFIMPLAHMSKKMVNFYLRDSYFNYLEQGLKEYAKLS